MCAYGAEQRDRRRQSVLRIVVTLMLVVAACTDDITRPTLPALSTVVTGAAAAALQANGQFELPAAPPGMVTDSQARALSAAFVRMFGVFFVDFWEHDDRAGPIDLATLRVCGRSYYARSPYEPLPSSASFVLRQTYGSYWLTSLCGVNGNAQVSVAVPAVDTQFHVDSVGYITGIAGIDSARFLPVGIAPGFSVPPSPESAVREVAQWTGRRVVEVPELVLQPPSYFPQLAKWRVQLGVPADFTELGDTTQLLLSEVYFGSGHVLQRMGLWFEQACGPAQFPVFDPETQTDTTTITLLPGSGTCYSRVDTVGQRYAVPRR